MSQVNDSLQFPIDIRVDFQAVLYLENVLQSRIVQIAPTWIFPF